MISLESRLAFAAASAVLLVIPGPTILTVISYSVTHGRKAASPLVCAVALGDSTALALSLLGIGSVLAASATAFTVVKAAGGVYLLFLGIRMIRAGVRQATTESATTPAGVSRWRLFLNTYGITATNPKGIIFFMAFLPQFVDATTPAAGQLWVLALTFVSLATINAALYTAFAGYAARRLVSGKARRVFDVSGGSLLSAAGLWTALPSRSL